MSGSFLHPSETLSLPVPILTLETRPNAESRSWSLFLHRRRRRRRRRLLQTGVTVATGSRSSDRSVVHTRSSRRAIDTPYGLLGLLVRPPPRTDAHPPGGI